MTNLYIPEPAYLAGDDRAVREQDWRDVLLDAEQESKEARRLSRDSRGVEYKLRLECLDRAAAHIAEARRQLEAEHA